MRCPKRVEITFNKYHNTLYTNATGVTSHCAVPVAAEYSYLVRPHVALLKSVSHTYKFLLTQNMSKQGNSMSSAYLNTD